MVKECVNCRQIKPYSMFNNNKNRVDGKDTKCKTCRVKNKTMYVIECNNCAVEFISNNKTTSSCSKKCSGEQRRKRVNIICSYCNKEHERVASKLRNSEMYCNEECKAKHLRKTMIGENNPNYKRVKYTCDGCSKEINVIPSKKRTQKYIFCSNKCYKENIGCYYTGENNNFYNPELSDEERDKKRTYPEYTQWRLEVFKRDKYTCKKCGDCKGGNLEAHHIRNYSEYKELRTELSNGVTLCINCHRDFHKTYGYRRNNENQLTVYLNNL